MDFIKVELNEGHYSKVESICREMPKWRLSYRGHEANAVGVLGEIIVEGWLQQKDIRFFDERGETTHDYRLFNNETFDVKTKDRTVPPLHYYECTAPSYNHEHQQPNFFIFVSLERPSGSSKSDIRSFKHAYILGAARLDFFNNNSVFKKKGDSDGNNKMKIKFDCFNLPINKLASPDEVYTKLALAGNVMA